MHLGWCPMEERTAFACGLITDGNNQIKGLPGELIPRFAARLTRLDPMSLQGRDGLRMHIPCRMAACAHGVVTTRAESIDQRLRHD